MPVVPGDSRTMASGSATTTPSNSNPFASTAVRCSASPVAGRRPGARVRRPPPARRPTSRRMSATASAMSAAPSGRPPVWTRRGPTPAVLTERAGCRCGANCSSSRAGQLHDLGRGAVVDRELVAGHRTPRRRRAPRGSRSHVAAAPARTACASSPARVNDCVGHRRATARHCIGERSWASSTTTWPYRASAGRTAATSPYVELVGELLVHAVQLVGGGITHERGRGVRDLALPAVQPVAAGRLARQVLEWAPAPRAVGQPLLQDPLGHVVERPSAPAGALRARRDGPEQEVGLVEEGHVGLAPSVARPHSTACSASSSSGVRMSRPAFARRRGDARRRRTSTSGVSSGHMAWSACASAPRSITSRSGGAYRTASAPMRPIRWSRSRPSRYAASSARRRSRSTSGRPPLCVVDRRLAVATIAARLVVVDHEAEPPRPQLDARPRRPLVGPDRPGEDVDHAEIALDRGRRGRVDLRHRHGGAEIRAASPARPCPHRATGRRPRRSAGTSSTARRRAPRRTGAPARRRAGTRPGGAPLPSCRYRAPLGRPSRRRGGDGSRRPARPGSSPPRPACDRSAGRRARP